MKITHVVNDLNTGGAQTLIAALAEQLSSTCETSIVVLGERGSLSSRIEQVVDDVMHLGIARSSWRMDRLMRLLGEALRSKAPDIIHSHLIHSDLASALSPIKAARICTVHTSGYSSSDPARSRALARTASLAARRFDYTVACCGATLQYMRDHRYPMDRVRMIENGVKVKGVSSESLHHSRRLLSLARWHPMKDHRNLFESVRLLVRRGVDVRLSCAGSGMDQSNRDVVSIIDELGLGKIVDLCGALSDIDPLLRDSAALVISSSYGEALPMAGLEALARSRPVLTTDIGSCRDLAIEPWMVVPSGDPSALADAIAKFLSADRVGRKRQEAAAFALVSERFNVEKTGERYLELYKEALFR